MIAIIAVLVAILVPAVQQAREAARRTQCKNNLKQVGVALHNYFDVHRTFPPGSISHSKFNPSPFPPAPLNVFGFGWSGQLLSFVEQGDLWNKMDTDDTFYWITQNTSGPWAVANLPWIRTQLSLFKCPTDPQSDTISFMGTGGRPPSQWVYAAVSNYVGIADSVDRFRGNVGRPNNQPDPTYTGNGMLFNISSIRMQDVTDGSSQTLFVGECTGNGGKSGSYAHGTWATGTPVDLVDGLNADNSIVNGGEWVNPVIVGGTGVSSFHEGGCNFLLVDGSVRLLSENINQKQLERLGARNDGEVVGEF